MYGSTRFVTYLDFASLDIIHVMTYLIATGDDLIREVQGRFDL